MNLDVLIWPENLLETNLSPANYHRFLCDKIHTFCLFYLMRHLRHEVPVKMSRIQVVHCDPDVVVIDKPASVPVSRAKFISNCIFDVRCYKGPTN